MEITKQKLVAGVDWDWEESVPGYPASTHILKYLLKKSTSSTIILTADADGDTHSFEIDKATTAAYASGYYVYQAITVSRSDANDIHEIGAPGLVQVYADLVTVSDARTHALKMVDNLRVTIEALSTKTMTDVSIEGRSYTYNDIDKLYSLLELYERKAGIRKKKRHLIQFSNT